jgi:DHA3 family macrolide efflux protein-like MFS transporter
MVAAKRLWNRNFSILWQGQLISDFGNVVFAVALGFWVLEMTRTRQMPTGNMALMGIVEACFALPGVLLGPLAGAYADRHSRKRTIVAADLARGILFTSMGATAIFNVFPFWTIYPLAVLSGACGAFFGPAISSSIPDIVPMEALTRANSARSLSSTATQLVGNSLGGLLYALLSAPVMILINGISFLYAACTQLFMAIPRISESGQRKPILHDMILGMQYAFGHRGIRALIIMNMVVGFFSTIIIMLLTPLFRNTPGFGVARFGYVMATMMAGGALGMLALSTIRIRPGQRAGLFCISQLIVGTAAIPFGIVSNVVWLFPLAFVVGVCNAIIGVVLQTVMQATIPRENRGKVFGILGTVSGALWPLGMASSGVIASLVGVRPTFVSACCMLLVSSLPILFSRHFREFMNTDIVAAPAVNTGEHGGEE